MVFAMSQANAALPMMTMGLNIGVTLLFSLTGGLIAAAATYYLFGKSLSTAEAHPDAESLHHPFVDDAKGILDVINRAGAEAFKIAIGAIPMLVLSLVIVTALRTSGAIDALTGLLAPLLTELSIRSVLILPTRPIPGRRYGDDGRHGRNAKGWIWLVPNYSMPAPAS